MKATFDRKFGVTFVADLPATPAVYLFGNDAGTVIYVGKAKNVRRRIATYRNASRRKVHRKQRKIVRAATTLEVRLVATNRDALLLENELIRTLRPKLNVEGKFDFLYPSIGLARRDRTTLVCFSTKTEVFSALGLEWYGCFRSRPRAREAFEACCELLGLIGHVERVSDAPRVRGSAVRGYRQLDRRVASALPSYFGGQSDELLRVMVEALLDKPAARRQASVVQEHLKTLAEFYRDDLRPLRDALRAEGRSETFVAQEERDALFLRAQ